MSVLLVDAGSGSRDDAEQTLLLAWALARRGRCLLALREGEGLDREAARTAALAGKLGVPVLPLPGGGVRMWRVLSRALRQPPDSVKGSFTVIHTLDNASLWVGALLRRRFPVGWIHRLCPPEGERAWLRRRALRLADLFIDAGDGASLLQREGLDASCLRSVPPCTPFTSAGPAGAWPCPKSRRERADGRFVFVASGALVLEKGWHILLQAMAYLQNMAMELPPWEVRLLGEGPLFGELLDRAEKLGVLARLAVLGGQDRRMLLPDADVAILPALSGSGDAPVALDAWACGVPVISTALPAHRDLGPDREALLLVPPANSVALAGAMLRLMQEPALRTRLVEGGRAALEGFGPEALADTCLALYAEAARSAAESRALGRSSSRQGRQGRRGQSGGKGRPDTASETGAGTHGN